MELLYYNRARSPRKELGATPLWQTRARLKSTRYTHVGDFRFGVCGPGGGLFEGLDRRCFVYLQRGVGGDGGDLTAVFLVYR